MVRYILRFTKYADGQLNTIYTDKRVYTNKLQFTEEFKEWNYELLQYVRPSTFYNANARGSISMGRIGELFYQIYEVGGINIVVVEKFYFKWLPFTTLMAVASSKNRLYKIDDAGYSYSIIQDSITKKMAIRKPNSQYLTKFVFDEIIGFHHSTEDYNKIHAIGFIGDRVYSIPLDGELKLLHMSKNDYLSMKHRYDEMLRKRINMVIENLCRQHNIRNNNTKRQNTMKQRIRLTEGDLHRIVRKCINEALDEMEWPTYYSAAKKMYNSDKPNSYDRAQSLMDKAVKEFNKKHRFDAVGDEHEGFSDQKPYRDIKTYHANNWGKEYGGVEMGTQAFEGNPDGTIPYSYGQMIGNAHYMPNRGDNRDITGPSHYHHGAFSDELVAAANKGNKELEDVYNGKIKYKNGHWS